MLTKLNHRKETHRKWETPWKISNLQIIGLHRREGSQVNGIDHIFNMIIEENFSKLREGTPMQIQEVQRTSNRQEQKRKSSQQLTVKTLNIHNKGKLQEETHKSHIKENPSQPQLTSQWKLWKPEEPRAMSSKY